MDAESSKAEPTKRKRRWFQFSLRTLLLATTAIAVACGWLGGKIKHKRKEREAAATIRKLPGAVHYDYQRAIRPQPSWRLSGEPYGPAWLRKLLGENFFSEIELAACRRTAACT